MPMYNLIEYNDNYSKTYFRDELVLAADNALTDFTETNAITDSFKVKEEITGQTGDNGTRIVEIMVPLKYLSNFWRTLNNCEINIYLNWSKNAL